ncbi:MAG TPA: ATP synthase subunit I [Gammaproteobacteria bacterium]
MLKSIPARIVFWQVMVAIAGALIFGLVLGLRAAGAAFAGGAIGALLSLYFAIKAFGLTRRQRQADHPQATVRRFFRAEALKLLMAAGLFSVAAFYFAEAWLPLMTTFVASQMVYGVALLWNAGDGY